MPREANESINSFDEKRDWMGRDMDKVEVYGSDMSGESADQAYSGHRAMIIGSAAIAAAAITAIVLVQRKRQRDSAEPGSGYEYEAESEVPASASNPKTVRSFRLRRLADRHLHRVSNTFDDIIDALVGTACGKLISLIGDAVPDFRSEYERTSTSR